MFKHSLIKKYTFNDKSSVMGVNSIKLQITLNMIEYFFAFVHSTGRTLIQIKEKGEFHFWKQDHCQRVLKGDFGLVL